MTGATMTASAGRVSSTVAAPALLCGLGTSLPAIRWEPDRFSQTLAQLWNLKGDELDRWERIVAHSGVHFRHAVEPIDRVITLSTAERMRLYERHATPLAAEAARNAMQSAGTGPAAITDLVVVSCTGFAAPGLETSLISVLGLASTVRRTSIGFMGCFGAITGLRQSVGLCAADRKAVVLLVCCELCSLHFRNDTAAQNMVATALFADGASAAIIAGERAERGRHLTTGAAGSSSPPVLGRLGLGQSRLLPHGQAWMTWRVTDHGFAMTLDRRVPSALGETIADFVGDLTGRRPVNRLVHPGGPGILDAVEAALPGDGDPGLACSRDVLRACGNMSSGTVLFVLHRALQRAVSLPVALLAFGPGLTIEGMVLECGDYPGE